MVSGSAGIHKPTKGEVVVGIDEVGRGPWAGPLVIGAVILQKKIRGVTDSKELTKEQREKLEPKIKRKALSYGLGWVWPTEIDAMGLTLATRKGIERALNKITVPYDRIIIDGRQNFLPEDPKAEAIITADRLFNEVSAASILAKVARDNYMQNLSSLYPDYGFEKHVGYATPLHIEQTNKLGAIPGIHRIENVAPVKAIYERTQVKAAVLAAEEAMRIAVETVQLIAEVPAA
jgi:ribonuclease HII